MESHSGQLSIPESAVRDAKAVEILRVWAAGGRQHVSIAAGLWDDPANWGIMLVDLARHIANAYEQARGMAGQAALERLRSGFDAEWDSSTDRPTGRIV
jgi:hypothetical protein